MTYLDFKDAHAFIVSLAATGRFSRNAKSQVLFEVKPGDYTHVSGPGALKTILNDALGIPGQNVSAWTWLVDNAWKLARTGTAAAYVKGWQS